MGDRQVAVHEEAAYATPFATLLRFRKDVEVAQPRVLLVAPMSGHFATLLRETVRTMLVDHDVFITDWHNARDVPLAAGPFGLDEYVEHVMKFVEVMGPGAHVVAICQPCVAALAATAIMAEDGHPATPTSLTLMAGPIDCRMSPTAVNRLATSKPIDWFERTLIATVPARYPGAMRRVYPGLRAAGRVHEHESRAASHRVPQSVCRPGGRQYGEGLCHAPFLRGILRGRRSARGVLPGDRACRCSRSTRSRRTA